MVDIIYQPADDPTSVALLRGQWQTEIFLSREARDKVFKRSRVTRLTEMQRRLDEIDAEKSTQK